MFSVLAKAIGITMTRMIRPKITNCIYWNILKEGLP